MLLKNFHLRKGVKMKHLILPASVILPLLILSGLLYSQDRLSADLLARHNFYRSRHGVSKLSWNSSISSYAQKWADRLASEDRMYHRNSHRYGENIYWCTGKTPDGSEVVDAWYSEIRYYNFRRPGFSSKTGHFTQVVWRGSAEIGCGVSRSVSGGYYVVCNYSPSGNFLGRFRQNVPPPKK